MENNLISYEGTIFFISHDRYFINRVATRIVELTPTGMENYLGNYDFYLDLRKYGTARHAGFGLGFERCVMYLTGMQNIRDVIPFPRTVNNCEL